MTIVYEWRGDFDNTVVNALHAEAFGHGQTAADWHTQVHRHSLGWVCARKADRLVGFVNVAWDGGSSKLVGVDGRSVLLCDQSDDGQPLPLLDSRRSGGHVEAHPECPHPH